MSNHLGAREAIPSMMYQLGRRVHSRNPGLGGTTSFRGLIGSKAYVNTTMTSIPTPISGASPSRTAEISR